MARNTRRIGFYCSALTVLGLAMPQPGAAQVHPISSPRALGGRNSDTDEISNAEQTPGSDQYNDESHRFLTAPQPTAFSVLNIGPNGEGAISLSWTKLGASFSYTVEFSDSLSEGNWSPLSSRWLWPITTTSWTDTSVPGNGMRFYRIKAVCGDLSGTPGLGDKAPTFSLPDFEGKEVNVAKMVGENTLVVVFWATWCGYCRMEVPKLKEIQETYQDKGLRVVAIAVNDTVWAVRQFVNQQKINYTVLMDTKNVGLGVYRIYGLPTLYVVGLKGVIRYSGHSADEVEVMVEALLKE